MVDSEDNAVKAKCLATLKAQFALRGHQVHELASGGFLVVWRGHSRHCGDMDSLVAFARQVGVLLWGPFGEL